MYIRDTMRIRAASADDIPWLVGELRAFASEYPVPLPIAGDDAYLAGVLGHLIAEGQYVAVAERDGRPVGTIAGALHPHPFNPGLHMVGEYFWWVVPEERGSRAGLLLLRGLEAFAAEHGVPLVLTTEATSAIADRTLLRRGYTLAERQWVRLPAYNEVLA